MKDGNARNVVVMTKEAGYRREAAAAPVMALLRMRYRKYPRVYERMGSRHKVYNKTLDLIADEVKKGTVFLIQPKKKSLVGRIEKDREKLRALYEEGYEQASECYEDLMRFLKNSDTRKEQSGK